ncbi:hypothetical protein [Cesiribacter sp. SM1]|uniref:hypothetical protein n=1 Tax=Cesiribacter sp. SM1 TaxID=2861196 RepID=UPI001CD6B55E|nr:hypothetical protein [Cesiribacter sp. SM1]
MPNHKIKQAPPALLGKGLAYCYFHSYSTAAAAPALFIVRCVQCQKKALMEIQETDDIDILLTLHPHGWSSCCIYVRDFKYEIIISHVFSDPYFDFIRALSSIINNQDHTDLVWYGEPGGEKIEISRLKDKKDKVAITISSFQESFGEEVKEYKKAAVFQMQVRQLILISYYQLKKIFQLLKDSEYSKNRHQDFPFQEYLKFEKLAQEYLKIL